MQLLMEQIGPQFFESELAEVNHFIEVGEYGLALETAVDICNEEKKFVTPEIEWIVVQLASAMQIEPQALVDRLRQEPSSS